MQKEELAGVLQGAHMYFCQQLEGLSEEQLLEIPAGFTNNIVWNIGHITDTLSGMFYRRSGFDSVTPDSYAGLFGGGTSPGTWAETPSVSEVVEQFKTTLPNLCADYLSGKFDNVEPYELMPGYVLNNVEMVLTFHAFHAGIHQGTVMAIKNALK